MYSKCSGHSYMYQIVPLLLAHVWALTGTLAYYYEDSPCWWCHGNTPVTSSGVGIPSYSNKLWYQEQYPLMQWLLIHVSNCATFVGTLCIHVWALTGTLAYYYEDSPHWWHHGNTPVTSSGVGIPSPTIISFGTDSNTLLFIWFNPYSETFFLLFLIHVLVFLLVGQVNPIHFNTIVAITLISDINL